MRYAGADWLQRVFEHRQGGKRHVSAFGAVVADILGATFLGIYHIEDQVLKADWSDDDRVAIVLDNSAWLATFDGCDLTSLVVLCHDACVRMEIQAVANGRVRLVFHRRQGREGSVWDMHPTIERAIELVRTKLLDARPLAPPPPPIVDEPVEL